MCLRENRPLRHLRAFPARPSRLGLASPRRGGLRTPAMTPLASPEHLPVRSPGVPLPPMIMLCLGLRTASQCGRGDRAPPRKPPSASSPAFPRKAIRAGLPPPAEGRALHAPSETSRPHKASPQRATSPPNALLKEPPESLFPNHTRTNWEPKMKAFFGIDQLPKCGIGRLAH